MRAGEQSSQAEPPRPASATQQTGGGGETTDHRPRRHARRGVGHPDPPQPPQQQRSRGEAMFVPDKTFVTRMSAVPFSSAFLLLVCAVSFLFGTLGQHDRGLLRASGSPSPVRISLYGPFPMYTGGSDGDAHLLPTTSTTPGEEPTQTTAQTATTSEASKGKMGNKKDGSEDEPTANTGGDGFLWASIRFLHRYAMSTLLVASSGELAVVLASFYSYGFDLEARLLGSWRCGALVLTAAVLRMLWLAVVNATVVRGWLAGSSLGEGSAAVYQERYVGLRPGPAWLSLMLLVVYEKRLRSRTMLTAHVYEPVPATTVADEVAPHGDATPPHPGDGDGGGAAAAAAAADATAAPLPPSATVAAAAERPQASLSSSFSTFPFGSMSATPRPAAVRVLGKIPVCAGTLRAAVALHLLLIMGFFEETIPALLLGLVL